MSGKHSIGSRTLEEALELSRQQHRATAERERQKSDDRAARLRAILQSAVIQDAAKVKAAADAIREVGQKWKSREIIVQPDVEDLCMDLLAAAMNVGAFSGPDQILFRSRLTAHPNILNAMAWLKVPGYVVGEGRGGACTPGKIKCLESLAGMIEKFSVGKPAGPGINGVTAKDISVITGKDRTYIQKQKGKHPLLQPLGDGFEPVGAIKFIREHKEQTQGESNEAPPRRDEATARTRREMEMQQRYLPMDRTLSAE